MKYKSYIHSIWPVWELLRNCKQLCAKCCPFGTNVCFVRDFLLPEAKTYSEKLKEETGGQQQQEGKVQSDIMGSEAL